MPRIAHVAPRCALRLRAAMRDYDLPDRQAVAEDRLAAALEQAHQLRNRVDVTRLLAVLPHCCGTPPRTRTGRTHPPRG
ncbi:hypothetical protein [Streptomyces melanogenes]|uniref:hypothetical protein n=1 Tax=Streptomyces melanogenes TaxID=67326 RepID=UPI0037B147DE